MRGIVLDFNENAFVGGRFGNYTCGTCALRQPAWRHVHHNYYNNIERFRTQCSKNLRKIREAEIKEEKFLMKRN